MKNILLAFLLFLPLRGAEVSVYTPTEQLSASYITLSGTLLTVIAPLAYGYDGSTLGTDWTGKIVLIDRGNVSFNEKLLNVRRAGGVGIIIANDRAGALTATLGPGNDTSFPAVTVSQADGNKLRPLAGQSIIIIGSSRPVEPPKPAFSAVIKPGSLTLARGEAETLVAIRSTVPSDWVIPDDETVDFPSGTRVWGANLGEAPVTVTSSTQIEIIAKGDARTARKGARWEAVKVAARQWLVSGQLENVNPMVEVGRRVVLWAEFTGPGPFAFQWQKDGVDLPGETGVALCIQNVTPAHSGSYAAILSTPTGRTESAAHVLTIK